MKRLVLGERFTHKICGLRFPNGVEYGDRPNIQYTSNLDKQRAAKALSRRSRNLEPLSKQVGVR